MMMPIIGATWLLKGEIRGGRKTCDSGADSLWENLSGNIQKEVLENSIGDVVLDITI
ncbi:hypothetical protein VCB84_002825 [Providencia rettgeri]|nr:hypothetical protein [Providencia rettgeri]EJD6643463.1 hypothetical protein [Providencia rettgeri]ELL9154850.1 hypothetical protein [Providencia rettgeri]ELR5049635.1 hypothetical protein [Providencia rettgeri]ELR5062653.1 hypothetical protein [Providencia rettgeri]